MVMETEAEMAKLVLEIEYDESARGVPLHATSAEEAKSLIRRGLTFWMGSLPSLSEREWELVGAMVNEKGDG